MLELSNRGISYRYIDSGQHSETTHILRKSLGIPEPDYFITETHHDIATIKQALHWTTRILRILSTSKKNIFRHVFDNEPGICLIHGDTLSTLFGLLLAKRAGLNVGHIEAGLRSFNILDPFPEELIRIYCMKHCEILFAPSKTAFSNLKKMKLQGHINLVPGNTVVDALRISTPALSNNARMQTPYILATCHRYETISKKKKLEKVIKLFNKLSDQLPMLFVTHKATRAYLERYKLRQTLSTNITVLDMQDYLSFTHLLRQAKYVLTDGGSIQEECHYLGKPCLIIRNHTEREDGLGSNARLWKFDDNITLEELNSLINSPTDLHEWPNPSSEIANKLIPYK